MKKLLYLLTIGILLCSLWGCKQTESVLLDSYDSHMDRLLQSDDGISRLPGMASGLCVIDPGSYYPPDEIQAEAGLLLNITDQETLYSKNATKQLPIASITKIMTALVFLEHMEADQDISIRFSPDTLAPGAVLCGFMPGDQVRMSDLLSAALIYSGNDAATDLALAVSDTQEDFVRLMNQRAKGLMAEDTNFVNPTGLHDKKHLSTAYDVYLMFHECLRHELFRNIIGRESFLCYYTDAAGEEQIRNFVSTNQYMTDAVSAPEGIRVLGGKTGHTNQAGYCLVILAEDSRHTEYIGVILGAKTRDELYEQMNHLLSMIQKDI